MAAPVGGFQNFDIWLLKTAASEAPVLADVRGIGLERLTRQLIKLGLGFFSLGAFVLFLLGIGNELVELVARILLFLFFLFLLASQGGLTIGQVLQLAGRASCWFFASLLSGDFITGF